MDDIKKLIEDTLSIPVIELFDPILPPCATWYTTMDATGLAGDGEETEGIESYQVDLWNRNQNDVRRQGRRLKKALTETGIADSVPEITYTYDNNGKLWRAMLTFSRIGKE